MAHHPNLASLSLCIGFTLVDVLQNWLNWLHFRFVEGGLLITLVDCMIFLLPFVDVRWMSMLANSFITPRGSGILCQ